MRKYHPKDDDESSLRDDQTGGSVVSSVKVILGLAPVVPCAIANATSPSLADGPDTNSLRPLTGAIGTPSTINRNELSQKFASYRL